NILVKHHQAINPRTMVYDTANRLTTQQQGTTRTTFTFDDNGNQTTENVAGVTTNNQYDRENRPKVIVASDATRTTHTYDVDGLRRTRQTASTLTTYVWDGSDYLQEYR
ncbi:MAG TPA: hypothetical protein PKA27_16405, partial [Fimbriimonadaceae bacterium]|nr:hypothetical protein [Fimbriimonadaceae bacterium]